MLLTCSRGGQLKKNVKKKKRTRVHSFENIRLIFTTFHLIFMKEKTSKYKYENKSTFFTFCAD